MEKVSHLSSEDGSRKPNAESWSLQEIIEHLVLAERGGFDLIYAATERFKQGNLVWTGTSENADLSIESIIDRTWKPKEQAPPSATPEGKWNLGGWIAHFKNCEDYGQI